MNSVSKLLFPVFSMIIFLLGSSSFTTISNETPKSAVLKADMRKLWAEHISWTRNVMLCIVDELPGTEQAIARLKQNQSDLGNAFKPYYGEAFSTKLTGLLNDHVELAGELIKVTKTGNSQAVDQISRKWYVNADKISELINKENSYLPLASLITMMNNHLKLTNDMLTMRIKKDYPADIKAYDKLNEETIKMSDMISAGIMKQFPKRFRVNKSK